MGDQVDLINKRKHLEIEMWVLDVNFQTFLDKQHSYLKI